jgi:hypothetical protein
MMNGECGMQNKRKRASRRMLFIENQLLNRSIHEVLVAQRGGEEAIDGFLA